MPMIDLPRPPATPRRLDDKIIPMINVIFLLLLFFLIAGSLTELEREGVRPPRSDTAPITAGTDGEWLLRPDGVIITPERQYTLAELRSWLAQPGVSLPASQQLRADGATPAGELLPLMQLLRKHGVERLALVTVTESKGG